MAPHYQSATLISSPSYPNAIAWSSENLVAVASANLVTILNPAKLEGPRGLVVLHQSDPFPIGVVNREDLFEPCLVPTCLARDTEPCARSISWSQQGFAPNSGCLLAVCTVDGHVKLYRSPIFEFSDEWVQVADISLLLFNYYKSINFGEDDGSRLISQETAHDENTGVLGCTAELQEPVSRRGTGQRKRKPSRFASYIYDEDEGPSDASKDADFSLKPCSKSMKKSSKKILKPGGELAVVNGHVSSQNVRVPLPSNGEKISLPLITAKQYASRDALLSSLVVAWSPIVASGYATSCLSRNWCILAVGSKSGNVSFWKMCKPACYTIDADMVIQDPMLIGVLQAHKSWVSALSWEISSAESSKSSLLLGTGCSDGSVKIWSGNIERLDQCTSAEEVPFVLIAEVNTNLPAPVSLISLSVSARSQQEVNLAIGRVSGAVEKWIWNMSANKIENASACHAHDRVVTGLSWGLDGHCLYSCSQDNSAHCWISHESDLEEIPVHTKFPELKDSTDLSEVSDGCFGLTLAPGGQMIAVVRNLDRNVLNQMYQARTQKAVVEFIWIGGQFLGVPLDKNISMCSQQSAILSATDFLWWGSNILWSLKKYENGERALVLWDVIAALQEFKKYAPTFVETLMRKWVSDLFSDDPHCVSNAPSHSGHAIMSNVCLQKLQLLNIICRKVMCSSPQHDPGAENGNATTDFWSNLLMSSERELRQRLVAFTFAAVLKRTAYSLKGMSIENSWFPVGVAQMAFWVSMNDGELHNYLKSLRSRIEDLVRRIGLACEYSAEESCTYCSAPVDFKSTDVAICRGSSPGTDCAGGTHRLPRCRASMRVCSVLHPVWHCVCCGGMVDKLLPESFFSMPASPWGSKDDDDEWLDLSATTIPICPFCGILLQRSVPEFLPSASPV